MNPVALIERKRDGGELSQSEYAAFISGYLDGEQVQEGQMAALLMAGVIQGFSVQEAKALTEVLLDSGDRLDLAQLRGPTVDKHSTGGVGDGTTLVVAPLLAAAGLQVVKLSGRGLGHTGGTLDKLESIPGMQVQLPLDRITEIAEEVGCVVAAQTADLVPADKALYALRDVTGTVPSMALIASSVMSKKLASGAGTIVLDVKAGDGAFMETAAAARELAELCVSIGAGAGRNTRAIVSDMSTPLGVGIGNGLEVAEVVETLAAPPEGRFAEVCLKLASLAASQAEGISEREAHDRLVSLWTDGSALETLQLMIQAQGGDPAVCQRPREVLPSAPVQVRVTAARTGTIARIPARAVGLLSMQLGAGRVQSTDDVDPAVGIDLQTGEGASVEQGQVLAVVHARTDADAEAVVARLGDLIEIGDDGEPAPTVLHVI
ncbi:thymidine phosphorylase [Euzebya tangerina]|uniref:thymidine phosphorylase n=1 Tax=Euzebya tangerina TaxID=591198 RepID=UPI000E317E32|nr:thymidine phosphorylase [Euzebya tangerina]